MSNTSGIFPKGNRVVVKPDELEEVTEGGIVLPETVRAPHQQGQAMGRLVAAGPDSWVESTELTERFIGGRWVPFERKTAGYSQAFAEIGDRVLFARYSGIQVTGADGETYRILNDLDITTPIGDGVEFGDIKARQAVGVA